MIKYIDLFSGSGGFSLGLDWAGFENEFSIDIDTSFNKTYRKNFPEHRLYEKDISTFSNEEIYNLTKGKKIDVIVGGPPCQGFSMAGNIGRKFVDDPRNNLFKEFARFVKVIKPNYFIMENVARLYSHNKNETRKEILKHFKELGYEVTVDILNTVDYDVPQKRRRVIFLGTKLKKRLAMPPKSTNKHITLYDAIKDLPKLDSGQSSEIPNHKAMKHTEQMLKKMGYVKDGGTRKDIPENLRPSSGDIRKYIRYNSEEPSICITGDMRKVFHPKQNRALTVRELARVQTYPDSFIFEGPLISQQQQVGNSVPPMFGYHLGVHLKSVIENE